MSEEKKLRDIYEVDVQLTTSGRVHIVATSHEEALKLVRTASESDPSFRDKLFNSYHNEEFTCDVTADVMDGENVYEVSPHGWLEYISDEDIDQIVNESLVASGDYAGICSHCASLVDLQATECGRCGTKEWDSVKEEPNDDN